MRIVSFARQKITVLRAPLIKDHGIMVRDWANAAEHESEDWAIEPGAGTEDLQHRDGVRIDAAARGPYEADVQESDRVKFGSDEFLIIGPPQRWASPSGRISHTALTLQAWKEI